MVTTVAQSCYRRPTPAWHEKFLALLPAIIQHARIAFRHLDPEARQEAVQAVVCNACAAVARLAELGKLDLAFASVLARYGVAQVNDGRKLGSKLNCRDMLSPYCQRLKHITVERLDRFDTEEDSWREAVVVDTRSAGVNAIVGFRIDFPEWLRSLSVKQRRIAKALAMGHRTSDVARRFDLSAARISQLRRELHKSWQTFIGDAPVPKAA